MAHSAYSLFLESSANDDADLEKLFSEWAKPPAKTEQTRLDNAVNAVRNAVNKSPKLKNHDIKVFVQGSYQNRVNVRQDSDVDIGVLCTETFFYDLPTGKSESDFDIEAGNAKYRYGPFKDELEEALVAHFGRPSVKRGNKAFSIRENSYHVEADVVPLFNHRSYAKNGFFVRGVALVPDKGGLIDNFPEKLFDWWPDVPLHYENGVSKNDATSRRFKSVVRIIKKLRNFMDEKGHPEAKPIPGYLIECLAWNVATSRFVNGSSWVEIVRSVLGAMWSATQDDVTCSELTEVDNIKYLFRPKQPWTRQQAHDFVSKAWDVVGVS